MTVLINNKAGKLKRLVLIKDLVCDIAELVTEDI